jgi:hypothetical protein
MGFRDPIRILEESTGLGGSSVETFHFAQATITAVTAPSGNALTLDPGDGLAPTITLDWENLPGGGSGPKARVGAPWEDLIPWTDMELWQNTGRFAPYETTGDGPGKWGWPKYRKTATRDVELDGLLRIANVSFGSGWMITQFPVGCRPRRMQTGLALGMGDAAWRWTITEDGTFSWTNYVGSGGQDVLGQYLSLHGIRWAADQ